MRVRYECGQAFENVDSLQALDIGIAWCQAFGVYGQALVQEDFDAARTSDWSVRGLDLHSQAWPGIELESIIIINVLVSPYVAGYVYVHMHIPSQQNRQGLGGLNPLTAQ